MTQPLGDPRSARQGWPAFLSQFHHDNPGITEDTLGQARSAGIDPYAWLLEPLDGSGRLLDLACGTAPVYRRRPSTGWVGLDASLDELRLARRRRAGPLVRADAARLPVANNSMSSAVCSMALMILQPLDAVLGELRRILTADGVAIALLPGTLPLTPKDLARYGRLMVSLRQTHLVYPNAWAIGRLATCARQAGLTVVDDRRRRFELPLPDRDAGRQFVRSLYLPGAADSRRHAASEVAAGWAGATIGIPLRRVTLRPA